MLPRTRPRAAANSPWPTPQTYVFTLTEAEQRKLTSDVFLPLVPLDPDSLSRLAERRIVICDLCKLAMIRDPDGTLPRHWPQERVLCAGTGTLDYYDSGKLDHFRGRRRQEGV
jgi:hypothetical protein